MTDGYNTDITEEQRQKLRELFPEVFTEDKIDFDKLRATLGDSVELGERYGLGWKGKSDVFAKIQEKTVSTLHPQPEESVDWDTTQNMFIEGDNLETLKVLHKAYYGKIKMIYIDPPYNTGNDFVYNDNFKTTKRDHAMTEGSIDDEGNATRDDGLRVNNGGHKHSNWLDMMYPRLFLARNLLKQDGVIFVSIDDNEVHNLRLMMNEIFGEENFVAQIIWERAFSPKNDSKYFSDSHDYILCFARNINNLSNLVLPRSEEANARYKNPDNDPRGPWVSGDLTVKTYSSTYDYPITTPSGKIINPSHGSCWRVSKERLQELILDNRVWFGNDSNNVPRLKRFMSEVKEGIVPTTLWKYTDVGHNQEGRQELKKLFNDRGYFDGPKPVRLMRRILQLTTGGNDIVLDFFGGSGTLSHAVEEQNAEDDSSRQWIMVQLPETTDEKSDAHKAGYKTISDISRERIRRASAKVNKDFADKIAKRKTPLDLGFRSYNLGESNFKKWNELVADADDIRQQTLDQVQPLEDSADDQSIITEILLKRGISPLTKIEYHGDFYFIPKEWIAISLTKQMTEHLFEIILCESPRHIILLDQSFNGDINLKTNLLLQAEKQNITMEIL